MTLWYDLSGLVEWRAPHLGGIERTTAGILAGMLVLGHTPHLVHVAPGRDVFSRVGWDELPEVVRGVVLGSDSPARRPRTPPAPPAPPPPLMHLEPVAPNRRTPRPRRLRDAVYGPGPDGEAFRAAWHGFKAAGRELLRHVGRRTGFRRSPANGTPLLASPPPSLEPGEAVLPLPPPTVPFARGDLLVSCGGTFGMPGHPHAVDAARACGVRVARMVYDLIPATKPQWLAPRATHISWLRHVAARSDIVLAISECTRRELQAYCHENGLAAPRTTIVRLGDRSPSPADDAPPSLPRFVPRRPFFLCVSTIDVRKNHRCLYEAWTALAEELGERCPDLVCVGMPHVGVTDLIHEIHNDPVVNRHLHLLHGVRDPELEWYYRSCVATIYPSKHEGWGLPVAESLAHGKLCLASRAASIPEIDAELPEFFAPHDAARLATLVARAIADPEWLAAREAEIRRRFRPTSWSDTAAAVLAALDRLDAAGEAA